MILGDTIAAIATAPGRGGVAVVRVSGPEAFQVAERLTGHTESEEAEVFPLLRRRNLHFWKSGGDAASTFLDEGVILFFKGPRSYTGEDVVEFQCHGGAVTPRRILEACFAAGARLARRGEFTELAFLNGKLDYDQAESVLDLVDAKTARAADAALEGLSGRKRRELRSLYESAIDLSAKLEYALDVDEGELAGEYVRDLGSQISELRSNISAVLRRANEGKILREGALVVLAGPPNAGKSSLMNALLEENRAIVSDIPGTTRDSIEEWLNLDGWPIRLVDTAGLREANDEVEVEGVKRAEELVSKADVIVWLNPLNPLNPLNFLNTLNVHSKCDLGRGPGLNVSAKTGEGLDELKREIVAKLEEKMVSAALGESVCGTEISVLQDVQTILTLSDSKDLVLLANAVRAAADRLGSAIGETYSSDLLDNLFSRFCIGK